MDKINKDFDGVSWEWNGKTAIRGLKPICPRSNCANELDVKTIERVIMFGPSTEDGRGTIQIAEAHVIYKCSNCDYSMPTTIDGIVESKDLRKIAQKEFERRQRLMLRKATKTNK